MATVAGGRAGARPVRGPRRGARRRQPLLVMVKGRRRYSSRARRVVKAIGEESQGRTRRLARSTPATASSTTAVDSEEEAFARGPSVPLLPAVLHRRAAAARASRRRSGPARRVADRRDPAQRKQVYKTRRIIEAVVDKGSFFEIGRILGPLGRHRPGAPRRLARRGPRQRPVLLWPAGLDRRQFRQADPLRRFRPDLPPAGGALVDIPGFASARRPKRPARSGTACGRRRRSTGDGAVVPVMIRKASASPARRCATSPARSRAGPGRPATGDRCRSKAVSRPLTSVTGGGSRPRRADGGSVAQAEHVRDPFRTAEAFLIEEIIDPRETRRCSAPSPTMRRDC